MTLQVDYRAVFDDIPIPMALLSPDFVIVDMNLAYLSVSGRKREDLVGQNIFVAFPDNPSDPSATGVRNLTASLRRAVATRENDTMALQRYDSEIPGKPGSFESRFWCPVNAPVFTPEGEVTLIVHCVEEVTDRVRKFVANQSELSA